MIGYCKLAPALALSFLLAAGPLAAQDEGLEKGEREATAFIGISDGEFTLGGQFGKAVTEKIFAFGEMSYIPGDSASSGGIRVSTRLLTFGGGAQYNFVDVFKNNKKFVPYAGGGLSLLRASGSVSIPGVGSSGNSDTRLYLTFGGGLRYYARPNWGIKPDVTVFAGKGSFVRASVGLFYQF